MKVIRTTPNESGAYPPIQELDSGRVPESMAVWPETLSTREFYDCGGFVTLDIADGTVRGYAPDDGAWAAWLAEQSEAGPEPAPMSMLDRLAAAYREGVDEA